MASTSPDPVPSDRVRPDGGIHPDGRQATEWFVDCVRRSMGDNLVAMAVCGPVATEIYSPSHHLIHSLIVTDQRDVDKLAQLATYSKQASRRGISPPLMITDSALQRSHDVFPLEWLDFQQYHVAVHGPDVLDAIVLDADDVRMQCERELRSLDIQLQRGILASGGNLKRVDLLERQAADSLVRVLRGLCWLHEPAERHFPIALVSRCEKITAISLAGTLRSIRPDAKHDLETARMLIDEIGRLTKWINDYAHG